MEKRQKEAQQKVLMAEKELVAKQRKFFVFSLSLSISLNTITNKRQRRWLRIVLHLGKTGSRRISDGGRRTAAPFDDDRLAEAEAEDNQK